MWSKSEVNARSPHFRLWKRSGTGLKDELTEYLERYEVIWPDPDLVDACARLRSERRAVGGEPGLADAWIAATALMLNCPLATHDRDFIGIPDLQLVQG